MGVSEAFAGANERIAESAVRLGFSAPVPFLCECDDRRCYAIVQRPDALRHEPVEAPDLRDRLVHFSDFSQRTVARELVGFVQPPAVTLGINSPT